MTAVIDLYGGPSTGKSTSAAYLYYLLKSQNVNAELCREYIKSWAYEGRSIATYDQLYVFGKQIRYESSLYNKVDYIVTDSPILLGLYYTKKYCPTTLYNGLNSAISAYYTQAAADGHKHYHVFLKRTKPYNPAGRYQAETEAVSMDSEIKDMLKSMEIPFLECGTGQEELQELLVRIQEKVI